VVVALLEVLALVQRVELAAAAQAASTHQHKRLLELQTRVAAAAVCLVALLVRLAAPVS
jgi:hypothetical protein